MRRPVLYLAGLLLATGASLALAGPASAAPAAHDHKCHHQGHHWDGDDDWSYNSNYEYNLRYNHQDSYNNGNHFNGINLLSGVYSGGSGGLLGGGLF